MMGGGSCGPVTQAGMRTNRDAARSPAQGSGAALRPAPVTRSASPLATVAMTSATLAATLSRGSTQWLRWRGVRTVRVGCGPNGA